MNLIRHVVEPNRLDLVWQAPEGQPRDRRVVAELMRSDNNIILRYLSETEDFRLAKKHGFVGFPAFRMKKLEHREGVLETFMRRLPPRSRSDFPQYLFRLRLPEDAQISDFALLGYSEAKLPSDGFSILNAYREEDGPCEFLTEIAGFRHYSGMDLQVRDLIGRPATFELEPTNEFDPNAVQVIVAKRLVGYVNRIQAPAFVRWLKAGHTIGATVDRINGRATRPQVYLFVSI